MATFAERFSEARKEAGLSQARLAELIGCGQSTVASIENGRNQGSTILPRASEVLGVSPLWLAEGRGPKKITGLIARAMASANVHPGPDVARHVPLISFVQAGAWSEAVDIYEPGYAEQWVPVLRNNGSHTFALRVSGDSMTATHGRSYPDGAIIVVDPDLRAPVSGQRIIAKLAGSNAVTFKVFVEEDGRRWLRPLNTQHPPIYDDFRVLGTVISTYIPE